MKLSDFLKQQGDTPQGKSTYQAFIDNFDKDYDAESFRKDEKGSIAAAFQWDICPEDLEFWDIVDNKWQEVTDPENDMLWLLDGKEPAQEADVEDELEERRMAKNECEARRREKLKKADGEPGIIDPMPKMAKGSVAIKEFLQITELKKSRGE